MKGILLSAFVDFLEERYDVDTTQDIIDKCDLASEGSYTTVGQYDYQELLSLLSQASATAGDPANEILDQFCDFLFVIFRKHYGTFFEGADTAISMLLKLDDHIHVEVKKLYPDASLPKFSHEQKDGLVHLHYTSPRPLAAIADALLRACIRCFDTGETLLRKEIADDEQSATFVIQI